MDQDLLGAEKSTNVRAENQRLPWSMRTVRAGFRVLSPTVPGLAARFAEHLFFSPRRHPRPAWEYEILERGERLSIDRQGKPPIAAWRWGDGARTVLLVHGWEGRGAQLGRFIDPLVDAGFRVVAFDAPGHGDSGGSRASPMHIARAIERVLEVVSGAHGIIAHSMGALGATLSMSRSPCARRLVYVAPAIDPQRATRAFSHALGIDERVRSRMQRRIEARFSMPMEDLAATTLAPRIEAPLLVIHDQGDSEVPWADGRTLVDAWPRSELLTTRGLGHRRILKERSVIDASVAFMRRREA